MQQRGWLAFVVDLHFVSTISNYCLNFCDYKHPSLTTMSSSECPENHSDNYWEKKFLPIHSRATLIENTVGNEKFLFQVSKVVLLEKR